MNAVFVVIFILGVGAVLAVVWLALVWLIIQTARAFGWL